LKKLTSATTDERSVASGVSSRRCGWLQNLIYKLFQKAILNVDAIFQAHVFVALAIAFHGATGHTGTNTKEKHQSGA